MRREIHKWYSPAMYKEMEIAVYGHYGFALLMFPTAGADFLEYERFQMIDSLRPFIDAGKIKVFSVNSFFNDSWLNKSIYPPHKAIRHGQWNHYIESEVVPFIYSHCNGHVPIVTTGASVGAYLAANIYFRNPFTFRGAIPMSGIYDIKYYSGGFYDDTCYFNSPTDFLPYITDERTLDEMRKNMGIVLASGQGSFEDPGATVNLSNILRSKGIPHYLELWGHDMPHDWSTWRDMLPYFIGNRF